MSQEKTLSREVLQGGDEGFISSMSIFIRGNI